MSHHKIEQEAECTACGATGLYVEMAERNGAAVVCHRCKGTGRIVAVLEWDDFTGRKERTGVRRVLEVNPRIEVGEGGAVRLDDFGGMSYQDWANGLPFPSGSEMRRFTCPAWWYQSANYNLKPEWDECLCAGSFSHCDHFGQKAKCWERFDKEQEATKGNR